jgi:hypothetical protein
MVTFECKETDCTQKDMAINFLGEIAEAECGGCKATLVATDQRPDPEEVTD